MKSRITPIACAVWIFAAAPGYAEDPGRPTSAAEPVRIVEVSRHAANSAQRPEVQPARARKQSEPAKGSSLSVYVPPNRGAVGARTGGGSRGLARSVRVAALVPDHIGLTTREQPTLAWFLSADTDWPAEITLIADGAVEPAVVLHLPGPLRAGIHGVDLAEHAARLAPGTTYDWTVALVLDAKARDLDIIAGGAIQRAPATPELARDLAGGEASYRALARNGIWYDAIADLSAAIAAAPGDAALRAERADLLEQVGVGAAAHYDREAH